MNPPDDILNSTLAPNSSSVFHEGELWIQNRVGATEKLARFASRAVRDHLTEEHREFFPQLLFLLICAEDRNGNIWIDILGASNDWIDCPTPKQLRLSDNFPEGSPLHSNISVGDPIGILGIQPHTQRRNRVNAHVESIAEKNWMLHVDHSFGNCRRLINQRHFILSEEKTGPSEYLQELSSSAQELIQSCDTFFIGSGHHSQGFDASHRGGAPGSVQIIDNNTIKFPDYSGNQMFATLGNILVNPRIALLFIDFKTGDLLQLNGTADINWDPGEIAKEALVQREITVKIVTTIWRPRGFSWRQV